MVLRCTFAMMDFRYVVDIWYLPFAVQSLHDLYSLQNLMPVFIRAHSVYHSVACCMKKLTQKLNTTNSFTHPNAVRCTRSHSTKFRNLVTSSNSSCRSTSLILCVKLGIRVFASSALSQHKLPRIPINERINYWIATLNRKKTKICSWMLCRTKMLLKFGNDRKVREDMR